MKPETPSLLWITAVFAVILTAFPLYYLILTSLKPAQLLFSIPPRFFFDATFDAYRQVFVQGRAGVYLANSFIVTIMSTLLATILGAMAAVVLALVQFRFKKLWFYVILITRMYPPITTLIPIYIIMRSLGLLDTYSGLILPYAGTQMALATWIMWSFYKDLPVEMFEAAMLDGCSPWRLLTRVAIPLSKPGLLACGILIFVQNWNEFLFALALTSTQARTAPVALMAFLEQEGMIQWGAVATIGTVMVAPALIFVIMLRKYLIQGLTVGATKG